MTILRATSDIAVAITVRSEPLKPSSDASVRPFWRAVTISTAELTGTRNSFSMFQVSSGYAVEICQPFLQIKGCAYAFQRQPQLHHRKRNFRLDAHNHRFRAPQFQHMRDGTKRTGSKGIDHIEHCNIDDDAA